MLTDLGFTALQQAYASAAITPAQVMADIRIRAAQKANYNIWLHLLTEAEQAPYIEALAQKKPEEHPLWGIPFAIKDNIDLANIPTTAGCEAFAYTPNQSAQVVQQLIDAGAIPVGKTALDQFATGLNGTRSTIGPCHNSFNPEYISGGSSSGSAVALALGLCSFSLGTDTAGSGRVPACFNNLVGLKPSRGLLSATGLVPACRSLDCISIFAFNTDDANSALSVTQGFDANDDFSRSNPFSNDSRHYGLRTGPLTIGVIPPAQLNFFGDDDYQNAYQATLQVLSENGMQLVEIDYAPFDEAARLLYDGPWVAERYLATQPLIDEQPEAIFPVVRDIIAPGGKPRATDLFKAEYRLNGLRRACQAQIASVDCLLTPTAGRHFTIAQMLEEPIKRNSELGYYTNFMNLADLASVAIPTQLTSSGMPFGITLVGQAFSDRALLAIGNRLQHLFPLNKGATPFAAKPSNTTPTTNPNTVDVVVCGAHLEGLPLNWQLTERGALLKCRTKTSPCYRLYALAGGPPFRPALVQDNTQGAAIDVELWTLPVSEFGSFVAGIPAPLGIGKVQLHDGTQACGFICEGQGVLDAKEITHLGSWRTYLSNDQLHLSNDSL